MLGMHPQEIVYHRPEQLEVIETSWRMWVSDYVREENKVRHEWIVEELPCDTIKNFPGSRNEFLQYLDRYSRRKKAKFMILFGATSQVDNRVMILECEEVDAHLD